MSTAQLEFRGRGEGGGGAYQLDFAVGVAAEVGHRHTFPPKS